MQELIRQRMRAGFVGRSAERAAFRANFDLPPEDERHRFLFHVHGDAGVGKTFLVREMEQVARERGALTAYVDEGVGSVPEALAEICRQLDAQGRRFKELERLLATYRERRHEAESAALTSAEPESEGPSAGSMVVARAGLAGLGMVPGVGAFAGALDAERLAAGADRLRAGLSARFRNHEDVQLVLSPERVLTPVLLGELSEAVPAAPWIVLFFDTYERTGPILDGWLREVMTTDRHGALPATVVVVTAGQFPLDPARWGAFADFMTDVPLGPFTDAEARGLLAARGVVEEPVVDEVLRLSGRLPVLVSTLAEARPADPEDVGDPSATAVERFLKWEQDPAHRAVALACALPRHLDLDVFRAAVDRSDDEADALFAWLRGLPFVDDRGDRLRYHDLVRVPMLRLQHRRSPRSWTERHERLADVLGRWREEAAGDLRTDELWEREPWRALLLEETYHRLCARPHTALGGALRDLPHACYEDQVVGRRWARMLEDAADATEDPALRDWAGRLHEALADDGSGVSRAMNALLTHPGLDRDGRAMAHVVLGRELRLAGEYRRALTEYDRAIEFDPELAAAHYGRGCTHGLLDDYPAALTDLDRADGLAPDTDWILAERGDTYRLTGRYEEAVADFDRVVALSPANADALASRAVCRHALGQHDAALADFDQALSLGGDNLWALVRRARLYRVMGEHERAFADLDRAVRTAPDSAWVASERGEAYRLTDRHEEAVVELGRALSLKADYASALASRGVSHHELGRSEEALRDLGRAIELEPEYSWALLMRAHVRRRLDDHEGMAEDLRRAVTVDPEGSAVFAGEAYRLAGRHEEAIAALYGALERNPDDGRALAQLGAVHLALRSYPEALRHLDRGLAVRPDNGWAHGQRALVHLATGRIEQALADWDRCVTLGSDVDWARYKVIETLLLCGRWGESLARLADVNPVAPPVAGLDYLRAEAFRLTGQWASAREFAERTRAKNGIGGTYQLALIDSRTLGLKAAEPRWRALAHSLQAAEPDAEVRAAGRCIIGWALAHWADGDRALAEFLATAPGWDDLAELATILTELLHSPDADRARIAPRLAVVTAARDVVQARYAE
ncbi:tetratricopeptide repeat protein [Streptomyces chartreusis]|uniref:tetratricopeptide repeat protein n=1 Tax=Streptomyces chartreusis TaxID=1969 RepID=UPI0036438959